MTNKQIIHVEYALAFALSFFTYTQLHFPVHCALAFSIRLLIFLERVSAFRIDHLDRSYLYG